ncbi:MAG: hypothetical protein OEY34_05185 [Cyclobacteriaceae bacterium]|nr:hypothetical protein [Cyclobacteriaceae bacterium]
MSKLKIAILIVFILIGSVYGWLEFRQNKSYIHALPQDVNQVLKVNMDQIYWEGFKYMIMHPSAISTKEDTVEKEDHGFDIGANLFFFTRKSSSEIIYLSVPIKDKKQAIQHLQNAYKLEPSGEDRGIYTAVSSTLPMTVALDEKRALFAYQQLNKDSTIKVLTELYQESPEENLINKLKEENEILSFLMEGITARLSFENDRLFLSGEIEDFMGLLSSFPFVKDYTTTPSSDSLPHNIQYFSLQVKGLVSKTDTIVSYEYNDDFEKVETKEIRSVNFPGIHFYYANKDAESPNLLSQEAETLLLRNGFIKKQPTEFSTSYSNINDLPDPLPNPSGFGDIEIDFSSLKGYELYYTTLPSSHSIFKNLSILMEKEGENFVKWHSIIQLNKDIFKILNEINYY